MGEHIDFVDFEEGRYDNMKKNIKHVGLVSSQGQVTK